MSISVQNGSAHQNHLGVSTSKRPPKPPAATASGGPSFEELYRDCQRYVWHVLRRLGVPEAEREDLVHEVFLNVHRSLHTFDASRPILPWLHGIAFHVAANHRKLVRHR